MITDSQNQRIRNFLTVAQLPTDIILEVEDHFKMQIQALMDHQQATFSEAFEQTKILWNKDLKLVKKSFFSSNKVPKIVRDIQYQVSWSWIKKSILMALFLILLQVIVARFFTFDVFMYIVFVFTGIFILISMGAFFWYLNVGVDKRRTRAEGYFFTNLINLFLIYMLFSFIGIFNALPTDSLSVFYNFIHRGTEAFPIQYFALVLFEQLFKFSAIFYFLFTIRDRWLSVRKLKSLYE